jgi:hypothetical protein
MIEKRIQRRLDAMTPALMVQLGKVYNSLKDGMSTIADWFEVAPATADGGHGASRAPKTAKHHSSRAPIRPKPVLIAPIKYAGN